MAKKTKAKKKIRKLPCHGLYLDKIRVPKVNSLTVVKIETNQKPKLNWNKVTNVYTYKIM